MLLYVRMIYLKIIKTQGWRGEGKEGGSRGGRCK